MAASETPTIADQLSRLRRPSRNVAPSISQRVGVEGTKCKVEVDPSETNAGLRWLSAQAADGALGELASLLIALPKAVRSKLRLIGAGSGSKLKNCLLCRTSSQEADPVLGELVYLLWQLEKDGITISGGLCWHCVGTIGRRFPDWKVKEVKDCSSPDFKRVRVTV